LLTGTNLNESQLFSFFMPGNSQNMEISFRCGSADSAKARFMKNVPVWRYIYADNKPGQSTGATHGFDLLHVFGNGQTGMSKVFQSAWAAFAKDPVSGLTKIGWPRYNPEGKKKNVLIH
jgi:cholinesterase